MQRLPTEHGKCSTLHQHDKRAQVELAAGSTHARWRSESDYGLEEPASLRTDAVEPDIAGVAG